MKEKDLQDDLASIRSLMERSSKFISLSGLSGILAGIYALIGAGLAYRLIYGSNALIEMFQNKPYTTGELQSARLTNLFYGSPHFLIMPLACTALAVLIASVITGYVLSARKAKRKGQQIWGRTSKTLVFNMAVPLVTGGLLIVVFMARSYYGIIAPATLIFYGLALISAGNFTFTDVKYLGFCEIILGLVAALYPGYGLFIWAIGFGVLHMVYGLVMYLKYDR